MKHTELLKTLKQLQFSGQLLQTDSGNQQWSFYLSRGSILYATGGSHPVKRWRRNLGVYCPRIPDFRVAWQHDLACIDDATCMVNWQYALLNWWVKQHKITREQATAMIRSIVAEVLFDIAQAKDVIQQTNQNSLLSTQLLPMDVEEAITIAEPLWQAWQNPKLVAYSPNQAPIIRQSEKLQKYCSVQSYQNLVNLLNGQNTLHDLALKMQQSVVDVAVSLMPFVRLGWIEFIEIPDLPPPVNQKHLAKTLPSTPALSKETLVACVDDSNLVLNTMEKLVTTANYQFLGISDSARAIGTLLARKPELIFLDLVMPNVNGYEICQQLRKLSCFRQTPIVILTGNDGYVNRLKSNCVGASDFLSKPLDADAVLSTIHKHLKQGMTPLSVANDANQSSYSVYSKVTQR